MSVGMLRYSVDHCNRVVYINPTKLTFQFFLCMCNVLHSTFLKSIVVCYLITALFSCYSVKTAPHTNTNCCSDEDMRYDLYL